MGAYREHGFVAPTQIKTRALCDGLMLTGKLKHRSTFIVELEVFLDDPAGCIIQIYGYLAPEYMTAEVDKLSFGAMPKPEEPARFVARLLPESEVGDDAADDGDEESCSDDDLEWSGQWDSNSRPPAPKAGALPD